MASRTCFTIVMFQTTLNHALSLASDVMTIEEYSATRNKRFRIGSNIGLHRARDTTRDTTFPSVYRNKVDPCLSP
jgi:hypothetical protein